MTERDQLKLLIDQLPLGQLARARALLDELIHTPLRTSEPAPGRTDASQLTATKKYPERIPVGGIITPQ